MSHPIEQRIALLRRRVRRLVLLYGFSATVAAVLAAVVLLGLGDYWIRFQDRGIRILGWLAVAAAFTWTCRRFLVLPLRARLGNVDLAVRVERHFPALDDRLVSAVEFLRQSEDDPLAGSAALRRAVITQATVATDRLNFTEALDRGPPLRAALIALAVALTAAVLAASNPSAARTALLRLLNPLGNVAWPQTTVQLPPAVAALRVHLSPPAYTGWPEETVDKNIIRALVGTRMRMEGTATKPLRAAVLCFEGNRKAPAAVSPDGLSFVVPADGGHKLLVEKPGDCWFELTDAGGLIGGSEARWEIDAVPDQPPSVLINRPTSNLYVTPGAVVPLRVTARDDLAVQRVALALERSDRPQQPPAEWPELLYPGPKQVAPQARSGLAESAEPPKPVVISYRWKLAPLGLPPGSQVTFFATATDYHGQTAKSEPRRLIVVTPEELQQRIAGRQELILAELARLLKLQRDGRVQVKSLEIRLGQLGALEASDLDHLQAAELNQRQVNSGLTSREDGIPMHVNAQFADLDNNRLEAPEIRSRMKAILDEITQLDRQHLRVIDQDLIEAAKSAQVRLQEPPAPPAGPDKPTAASLAGAGRHQDQVVAALEAMLGRMNQWDSYRRFFRDVEQLLSDQEELARGTAEVGRRTLTKELKDLQPQELADLKVLAERQLDLARRLDRLQQEMDAVSRQLQATDPLAAGNVADAAEEARSLAVAAQMHSAAGSLQDNQIGQVTQQHKQIVEDLQKVLDILANRRRYELAGLVKKQKEAEAEAADLQRRQDGLRKKIKEAAALGDAARRKAELERLAREQEKLQEETRLLAQRLERILAGDAAAAAQQAGGQMGQASKEAAAGHAGAAAGQAAEAAKSLEEARRQLAAERLQAQAELLAEQLARLDDAVKHLQRGQQNALDETRRIDELQRTAGHLTRGQALSLRDLARLQESLRADTARLAGQLGGAATFALAISAAEEAMGQAAALLDRRQTDAATQQAEQDALGRLALVSEALKPEKPDSQGNKSGGGGGGGQGNQGNQGAPGGVRAAEELKLLKLLQQEVNLRTRRLDDAAGAAESLTAAQQQEFSDLGQGQGRLADLVMQMIPAAQGGKPAAELQRELGQAAAAEDENPLLFIGRQMRSVQGRLGQKDAGRNTQTMQQEIIDNIDRLLKKAQEMGSCCSSCNKPAGPRPGQPKQPGKGSGAGTNPARKADATTPPKPPTQTETQRRPTIDSRRPWGKLPDRERARVQQIPPDEFLPKYQEMIEDYYRRLSRQPGEDESPADDNQGPAE